jgi:nucleotide-binding universal stress UspA family protein
MARRDHRGMNEIVVGVDGSSDAAEALRWGADFAARRGLSVRAVLAWDTLDQRYADRKRRFQSDYGQADAEAALEVYVTDALGSDHSVPVTQVAPAGPPAQVLLDVAADASMLVVGARGFGHLRAAVLGSVSLSCAQLAPCPLAIVRGLDHVDSARPRRIVVGLDGSAPSLRALDWALDEARATGAAIEVVHAWHPAYLAAQPYAWTLEGIDQMERDARDVLDSALAGADTHGLSTRLEPILVEGPASQRLLETAKGADLIVVGSRGLGGFSGLLLGSVSQQLAHHADCPVVIAAVQEADG